MSSEGPQPLDTKPTLVVLSGTPTPEEAQEMVDALVPPGK